MAFGIHCKCLCKDLLAKKKQHSEQVRFEHPIRPEGVSGEEIPILVQYVVLADEDLATRQYPLAAAAF